MNVADYHLETGAVTRQSPLAPKFPPAMTLFGRHVTPRVTLPVTPHLDNRPMSQAIP
jgi:hypothetical protein